MNNTAIIAYLKNVRKHTNADKLQCATVAGDQVIVDLQSKENDLGIYFDSNLQLSPEFLSNNNLYRHSEKNLNPEKNGFFEDNGRVRCITLRGEKSYGFWLPLNSLQFTNGNINLLEEGYEFNDFNGIHICNKYVVQVRASGPSNTQRKHKIKKSRILEGQFNFHEDTDQLPRNIHRIHQEDLISLSWKMHGTSAIVSRCLVKNKLNLFLKFLQHLGVPIKDTQYDYIYASRRVIKNEFEKDKQHFYDEDLWTRVGKEQFQNNLYAGETVYYEIVGYTNSGAYIQKSFDYNCNPSQYKIFVYRITYTNVDGKVIELQWNQLKQRCEMLGVETVPEIYYGYAKDLPITIIDTTKSWQENFLNHLKSTYTYDQNSQFCKNNVPEEGIVLRRDGLTIEAFKLKNFRFLQHESTLKDDDVVDIEDQN